MLKKFLFPPELPVLVRPCHASTHYFVALKKKGHAKAFFVHNKAQLLSQNKEQNSNNLEDYFPENCLRSGSFHSLSCLQIKLVLR